MEAVRRGRREQKKKVDETRRGVDGVERGRWKQSKEQHSTKQCSTISGVVGGG